MSGVRSFQRVLGRSRVMLLAVLVAAVFFTAGFAELAMTRRSMQAQYHEALVRVERTKRQNTLLQLQLERAQRNELLPWLAWDMFGKLPKGARGIQTQPVVPAAAVGPTEPEAPTWRAWLKTIGIN